MERFSIYLCSADGDLIARLHPFEARLSEELNRPAQLSLSLSKESVSPNVITIDKTIRVYDSVYTKAWVEAEVDSDGDLVFGDDPDWVTLTPFTTPVEVRQGSTIELTEIVSSSSGGAYGVTPSLSLSGDVEVRPIPYRTFDIKSISETRNQANSVVLNIECEDISGRLRDLPSFNINSIQIEGNFKLSELLDELTLPTDDFRIVGVTGSDTTRQKNLSITVENILELLARIAENWTDSEYVCWFSVTEPGNIKFTHWSRSSTYSPAMLRYNLLTCTRDIDTTGMANHLIPLSPTSGQTMLDEEVSFLTMTVDSVDYKAGGVNWFLPEHDSRLSIDVGDTVEFAWVSVDATVESNPVEFVEGVYHFTAKILSSDLDKLMISWLEFRPAEFKITDTVMGEKSGLWLDCMIEPQTIQTGSYYYLTVAYEGILPETGLSGLSMKLRRRSKTLAVMGAMPEPDALVPLKLDSTTSANYTELWLAPSYWIYLVSSNGVKLFPQNELDYAGATIQFRSSDVRGDYVVLATDTVYDDFTGKTVRRLYLYPRLSSTTTHTWYPITAGASELELRYRGQITIQNRPFYESTLSSDDYTFYFDSYGSDYRLRIVPDSLTETIARDLAFLFEHDDGTKYADQDTYYEENSAVVLGHLTFLGTNNKSVTDYYALYPKRIKSKWSKWFPASGVPVSNETGSGTWSSGSTTMTVSGLSSSTTGDYMGWTVRTSSHDYTVTASYASGGNVVLELSEPTIDSGSGQSVTMIPPDMFWDVVVETDGDEIESDLPRHPDYITQIKVSKITATPFLLDGTPATGDLTDLRIVIRHALSYSGLSFIGSLGRVWTDTIGSQLDSGDITDNKSSVKVIGGSSTRVVVDADPATFTSEYVFRVGDFVAINGEISRIDSIDTSTFADRVVLNLVSSVTPPSKGDFVFEASIKDTDSIASWGERIKTVRYEDYMTADEFMKRASDDLSAMSLPALAYSANAVDLKFIEGDNATDIRLGLPVRVIDYELDVDVKGLIITSIARDLLESTNTSIQLAYKRKWIEDEVMELRNKLSDTRLQLVSRIEQSASERCVYWDNKFKRCLLSSRFGSGQFCETKSSNMDGRFTADGKIITVLDCPRVKFTMRQDELTSVDGNRFSRAEQTGETVFIQICGSTRQDADGYRIIDPISFIGSESGVDFIVNSVKITKLFAINHSSPEEGLSFHEVDVRPVYDDYGRITTVYSGIIHTGTVTAEFDNSISLKPGVRLYDLSNVKADELVGWWIFRKESGTIVEGSPISSNQATESGETVVIVRDTWSAEGNYDYVLGIPGDRLINGQGFILELKVPNDGDLYDVYVQWSAEGVRLSGT